MHPPHPPSHDYPKPGGSSSPRLLLVKPAGSIQKAFKRLRRHAQPPLSNVIPQKLKAFVDTPNKRLVGVFDKSQNRRGKHLVNDFDRSAQLPACWRQHQHIVHVTDKKEAQSRQLGIQLGKEKRSNDGVNGQPSATPCLASQYSPPHSAHRLRYCPMRLRTR